MPIGSSTFTATWTPPDSLTGVSKTVDEDLSRINLEWDASSLADVDFEKYSVYRRLASESDDWHVVHETTTKTDTTYTDILVAQLTPYEYKVTQWKVVPGNPSIESGADIVPAQLESDVWFVIGRVDANDTSHSRELPVIEEEHSRPIQQEVFEPIIGTRKKIARGNTLGYEGALTMIWTADEREAAKSLLAYLSETKGPHLLKSPFGDVWYVEFDTPDYRYMVAGNITVEMGWVEVE